MSAAPVAAADDGGNPYASYNKEGVSSTLIGNWQEERSLADVTGINRYQTWVEPDEPTSIYPKHQTAKSAMDSHPRLIEHSDQLHPHDYRSSYQAAYSSKADTSNPLAQNVYKNVGALGPRERLAQAQLLETAQRFPDELEHTLTGTPVPPVMASTYREGFQPHDLTGLHVGAKVMMDRDGRPAVRDPMFLAESQIIPKHRADRLMPGAPAAGATTTGRLPDPAVPITIYSEAVANQTYGGTVYGTRSLSGPSKPFNKDAGFSKPLSEYNKVVENE